MILKFETERNQPATKTMPTKLVLSAMLTILVLVIMVGAGLPKPVLGANSKQPKLTVLFLVDQARFNYPFNGTYPEFQGFNRHADGAYQQFFNKGVVFDYSEFQHAATYTAQGWETIMTGANPNYNQLPHSKYYEYNKQGHSAVFDPMNGIKKGTTITPVPDTDRASGSKFDFKVDFGSGEKVTAIQVRSEGSHISIKFRYRDLHGNTRYSPTYGDDANSLTAVGYPLWQDIPMDIIGSITYLHTPPEAEPPALYSIEFYDHAANLIHKAGSNIDIRDLKTTKHKIVGDIIGGKGLFGRSLNTFAFSSGNQSPGSEAHPGEIKTLTDSYLAQFPGGKAYAVGDWSYPLAALSGKKGKGFWLGDAINGFSDKGKFSTNLSMYPDIDGNGEPDLPSWMSDYNSKDDQPAAKRVLDTLTEMPDNPWAIKKCEPATHDKDPCWLWNTLEPRNAANYVNYPYDDDRRGVRQKYELSKNACAIYKHPDESLNFPYKVAAQPNDLTCPASVNGGLATGWGQNAYQNLLYSPFSVNVVVDAAKKIIQTQKLGLDSSPDLLVVYIGSMDMVGHLFGIDSIEYEDTFYRVDKALGELIRYIDGTIGRDNVLYTLTGDHGMASTPEYKAENPPHLQKFYNEIDAPAGRLMIDSIETAVNNVMMSALMSLTKKEALANKDYVIETIAPTVYMDLNKIRLALCDGDSLNDHVHNGTPYATINQKSDFTKRFCSSSKKNIAMGTGTELLDTIYVRQLFHLAVTALKSKGVLPAGALSAYSYRELQSQYESIFKPTSPLPGRYVDRVYTMGNLVKNMYRHGRSGQIYLVPKPNYYFYHSQDHAGMHGSPYWYDRYVQLMYLGGPTGALPADLRRVRNLAYEQNLGDNTYQSYLRGIKPQQRDIVSTIGRIMDIDYSNMPQAYRDRVKGAKNYHSTYRLLTHLYRDDDYMQLRFTSKEDKCLKSGSDLGSKPTIGTCDNSDNSAWHFDYRTSQLKNKFSACMEVSGINVKTASCDTDDTNQRLKLVPHTGGTHSHQRFLLQIGADNNEKLNKCLVAESKGSGVTAQWCSEQDVVSLISHADSVEYRALNHGPIDLILNEAGSTATNICFADNKWPALVPFNTSCANNASARWRLDRGMLKNMHSGRCVDADAAVDVDTVTQGSKLSRLQMIDCATLASKNSSNPGLRKARIELQRLTELSREGRYKIKRINSSGDEAFLVKVDDSGDHNGIKYVRWVTTHSPDNLIEININGAR